jgi:diaminopimelate decarboxylase
VPILEEEIKKRDAHFSKPLYVLDQQKVGTEADLLALAIKQKLGFSIAYFISWRIQRLIQRIGIYLSHN